MSNQHPVIGFARERVRELLESLERLAAGDTQTMLPISPLHDELDAIAFGINALADELRWLHARNSESERVNFATAFHANPCGMAITRASDGCFLDVNAAFERQTGYVRDEVVGRTLAEIGIWIDPDDAALASTELWCGGRVGSREVRYQTKAGRPSTAACSAEIIQFRGETCVLVVGLDVTDRRHAEVQAATLREELAHLGRVTMLDALTGSIAHEINQPLTAVMANTEAALQIIGMRPLQMRELRETLNDILRDNKRAGDVVWRTRAMLKKGAPQHERIDVNASVSEVVRLVQANAMSRAIDLKVLLAQSVGDVQGDRTQIQQVVLNLLMNAFDAVQDCTVPRRRVQLKTFSTEQSAAIEVIDQGSGLPDEALAAVFEPFYTTKRDGLGLGLWICRGIVAAHGGTLDARRNAGTGVTFTALLPLAKAANGQRAHETRRFQEQS